MWPLLEELAGRAVDTRRGDWRPGVTPQEGVRRLWEWVSVNRGLFD
nr:hypothetical protein [Chloroflexota bacterium]